MSNFAIKKEDFDRKEVWNKPIRKLDQERAFDTVKMIPEDAFSILEIGCGNGIILNKIDSSRFVVGMDFSEIALGYVNREKVIGHCACLPFTGNSFDLIIAAEILEHLDNGALNKTLEELERVARKYILISTPFKEWPWETFVRCADCSTPYSPYGHQQYFDEERIRDLIKAGQQEIKLSGHKKTIPWMKRLGQRLLGIYDYRDYSICPSCNSNRLMYGSLVAKLYNAILFILQKLFGRKKPNWVICLYDLR